VGSRLHATSDGAPVAWDLAASSAPAQTVRLDKRSRRQDASTKWSPEARRLSCSDAVVACTRALLHATMLDSMIHRRPVPLYRVGDSAGPRAREDSAIHALNQQLRNLLYSGGNSVTDSDTCCICFDLWHWLDPAQQIQPCVLLQLHRTVEHSAAWQVGPTPTTRLKSARHQPLGSRSTTWRNHVSQGPTQSSAHTSRPMIQIKAQACRHHNIMVHFIKPAKSFLSYIFF
jgi:hypothetical protein